MYCVLHTSTFTVSQKTQNNVHPQVSALQHLVLPHPVMSVFTSQLPAFSPDVCAAWCRHQVPRYLLSYTDIYISRYLHIYRYLHTRCLHHQISYILLETVEEASAGLQSRPRDLLPCFYKPEQSGAGHRAGTNIGRLLITSTNRCRCVLHECTKVCCQTRSWSSPRVVM